MTPGLLSQQQPTLYLQQHISHKQFIGGVRVVVGDVKNWKIYWIMKLSCEKFINI